MAEKTEQQQPRGIVIATSTFVADVDGTEHYVRTGDKLTADHPAAKAHPKFFREKLETD